MTATSPTGRSLELLRSRGLVAEISSWWNPFAKKRKDLFGWIDLIALDPLTGDLTAVQTTSDEEGGNSAKRVAKIQAWPHLECWLLRHKAVVHAWRKVGARGKRKTWECREIEVVPPGSAERGSVQEEEPISI